MALTGIQIYKLLPRTNCKDCGFPTCLAFAMKLAAKQIELADCPHVSDESKSSLAESAAPPIRLVTISSNGHKVEAGNEVVLFRHEKTFYHKPGFFLRVTDQLPADELTALVARAGSYNVNYVGIDLELEGFAVECRSGSAGQFASAVSAVVEKSDKPLILLSDDVEVMKGGLQAAGGTKPLIHCANEENWQGMAALAVETKSPLAVTAGNLSDLTSLVEKVKEAGVENIVLDSDNHQFSASLHANTQVRRLALKKNFRSLGYPTIAFPGNAGDPVEESMLAAQAISKYAGFIVIDHFSEEMLYPLLVLRENIYTDPQKPIQVQPGLYEFNNPGPDDPLLVTTNFSITYFSVANEVESSGLAAWLLVTDAEGMSVLTAWAAGKFDAERIAKDMKQFDVAAKLNHQQIVIPGHVAVISGELEDELPGWTVRVGPREAVHLPSFLKSAL